MYFVKDYKHLNELTISLNTTNHAVIWACKNLSTIKFDFYRKKIFIENKTIAKELKPKKDYYLTSKFVIIINDDIPYSCKLANIDITETSDIIKNEFQSELHLLPVYNAYEICEIVGYTIEQLYAALQLSEEQLSQTTFRIIDVVRVYENPQPIEILQQIKSNTDEESKKFIDQIIDKYSSIINTYVNDQHKSNNNPNLTGYFKDIFIQIVEDVQDNKYILDAIDSYLS